MVVTWFPLLVLGLMLGETYSWQTGIGYPVRRAGIHMQATTPSTGDSITVLGGTGFVGSEVCKKLVEAGAKVRSVSRSGTPPERFKDESWVSSVQWVSNDLCRGSREELSSALGTPDVVVSCIGAIGFDTQGLLLGNAVANIEAVGAAKKLGVTRYVYCSVASEVAACRDGWLPSCFTGYFDGKRQAEEAILEAAGESGHATIIKPGFVYGGDDFGLFPPRVNSGYGSAVEEILSLSIIQSIANVLPGLLKVALRPPVSVDAVASACAIASTKTSKVNIVDGTTAINELAGQPPATGFSDAVSAVRETIAKMTE